MNLFDYFQDRPIVPFIRESDLAVRSAYYFPSRKLLDYLFIYIRKGELDIVADGMNYHFTEGQFCLLQPGTIHDLKTTGDNITPYAHLDLFYHPQRDKSFPTRPGQLDLQPFIDLLQPRLNAFDGISVPVQLQPGNPYLYRSLFMEMVESWLDADPLSKLKAQACATQLVHLILQDHSQSGAHRHSQSHHLEWIPSYFSFHLAEPLRIDELAKRAHLSPSRFRAVFRQQFGLPPFQYFLQLRLDHAKELLKSSDYSITKISEYCGFSDISHFNHAFRTREGMSPRAFRERRENQSHVPLSSL